MQVSMKKNPALQAPSDPNSFKRKSGPKPLLLSASNLMTTSPVSLSARSANSSPIQHQEQWSEVSRQHVRARESQSSQSSISEGRQSSEFEFGRAAPLRRSTAMFGMKGRSKDPKRRSRTITDHSLDEISGFDPDNGLYTDRHDRYSRGWNQWNAPDSPATAGSSTAPPTPRNNTYRTVKAIGSEEIDAYDGVRNHSSARRPICTFGTRPKSAM